MSFRVIEQVLSSALAASGTLDVSYPTGYTRGNFVLGNKHIIVAGNTKLIAPSDFTITLNASTFRITLGSGESTIPAGTKLQIQLDMAADNNVQRVTRYGAFTPENSVEVVETAIIELGSPATADADGICASQSGTAATAMTINGALASGGVATFDVPRNVVAAWTGTATLTVVGTDAYGDAVTETSGSGTSMAGKKAFKTITSVTPSGNITSATVGSGDVLGLPCFLKATGLVLKELENGSTASAGTVVAGDGAVATATTGDVRGTYDPNSACDGSKGFALIVAMLHRDDLGVAQYSA